MSYKALITTVIVMMLTVGCSVFERVVYHPDINQGNYLTTDDIARIHIDMTKQQAIYILGTPMMKDPFGSNTWYYIFRRELGDKTVSQKTLTLTFDSSDILTHIDYKSTIEGPFIS
ncbi:outer membrane protein assembly factor BamE [Candidatus Doolittlea endobia]|nr:outer membrane protein assembly factor BamE [Candidatus Doolittlea endobia]